MKLTKVGTTKDSTEYRNAPDNFDTAVDLPPGEIRISVRSLVEFILRHGDIDNRHHVSPDNAMQEGSKIHRMIQRQMGAEYKAEVPLKYTLQTKGYTLIVEGRADGIIDREGKYTIDEIKGTYRDVARMHSPMPLHVAQAKCYAYIYALKEELETISIRMTYCNIESMDIRFFYEDYTFEELREWFEALIEDYQKWAEFSWKWRGIRQASIDGLQFPFPYREGQKELVTNVYKTIYHKRKLFIEAPTGVGKTISTIYPAVQAMGQGMGDKLFYLTAKTITRTVADDTLNILREKGLRMKSVILTAKEKICFMEEMECNPEHCPYACGHYDRINDAVYDLLTHEDSFSREVIEDYARKHQVCPFEMCLDMSLFADAIICDYNYLFDPHVYLKRFFGDGTGGNYIFLIDEAHNLLERGREMYSAVLWKEQFMELRREIKQTILSEIDKKSGKAHISGQMTLEMTSDSTDSSDDEETELAVFDTVDQSGTGRRKGRSILVKEGFADKLVYQLEKCNQELLAMKRECEGCNIVEGIDSFMKPLLRLHSTMDEYLSEQEEGQLPVRELLLEFYFEVSHFLQIYELVDENYVKYTQLGEDGSFLIKLFCVNPRENFKTCMMRGRSTILFSATFLPIQYYKKLLGGEQEDYEVYAKSIFNPAKRALFIANDVTSKYTRRSDEEYYNIARYIDEIVKNRHGNYMVFFPSYAFMRIIYDIYMENFAGEDKECIIQGDSMSEADREAFLNRFRGGGDMTHYADTLSEPVPSTSGQDTILIGFCVMGGIFSEGIDLKNDSLIGAIIVGTGLPQVCNEREILKAYFDESGDNGFDYSYRYPGMNKVLQAAGRVIRTVDDVGIIALLDERFLQSAYRKMFPREWEYFETVTVGSVSKRVERFWDEWL